MIIGIYTNNQPQTLMVKEKIINLLNKKSITVNNKNPQIVISIGGDGTFLGAFHKYSYCIDKVTLVGIHTGHLGFYTDWSNKNLEKLVDLIINTSPEIISCPILNVNIEYLTGASQTLLALNESTVRKNNCQTQVANVYINGNFFEEFRGDGLCFSTPTGSTAYNKSIGGAIIDPDIEAYQMSEIASLNNVVFPTLTSSVIVPKNKKICVELLNPDNTSLTVDQKLIETPIKKITFSLSKSKLRIAHYCNDNDFWERVQHSFIGTSKK